MNRRLIFLSFCTALIISCTKEPQDIETIQLTDDLFIESTDTITPVYTVFRLDSFQTSGSNTAIIGGVTDPYFGRIESNNFSRFKLATNNYLFVGESNEYFDSVVLIMHCDSTYYGDTMSNFTVSVNKVRQEFDATAKYYNHNTLLFSPDVLGETTVRFRPNVDDSIRVRLSNDFGSEIFEMYRKENESVKNQDAFQRYLRGLRIAGSSPNNNVVYRFPSSDSTLYFRLYYHQDVGDPELKHLDFPAEGNTFQFNQITCDVSSSDINALLPGEEIRSEQLNNRFYFNDLAGIGTKITFPSAEKIAAHANFLRVSDAVLFVRPIALSFEKYPLIPSLGMSLYNESTQNKGPLYSDDNSYVQTGNLFVDNLVGTRTGYVYDVASIMRNELSATLYTTITAALQPYSTAGTGIFSMQRLVAADNRHPLQPSTLQTQMIFYKQ